MNFDYEFLKLRPETIVSDLMKSMENEKFRFLEFCRYDAAKRHAVVVRLADSYLREAGHAEGADPTALANHPVAEWIRNVSDLPKAKLETSRKSLSHNCNTFVRNELKEFARAHYALHHIRTKL